MTSQKMLDKLFPTQIGDVLIVYVEDPDEPVMVKTHGGTVVVEPYVLRMFDYDVSKKHPVYMADCLEIYGLVDRELGRNGIRYFHKDIRIQRKYSLKPRWLINYRVAWLIRRAVRAVK